MGDQPALGALNILQQKAATGQDLSRVSDDPSRANQILGFQSDQRKKEVYLKTMEEAISILDLSSSVVQSIMSEMASGSGFAGFDHVRHNQFAGALRTLATEADNALEQVVSFANSGTARPVFVCRNRIQNRPPIKWNETETVRLSG